MSKNDGENPRSFDLVQLRAMFGSPPVLSTEDPKAYEEIWVQLIGCFMPRDLMEHLLIHQLTVATWDLIRYTRHATIGIDRKTKDRLRGNARARIEHEIKVQEGAKERERQGRPLSKLENWGELEDKVESAVADVDAIVAYTPPELQASRSLQAGMEYQGWLDDRMNSALRRRNDALVQLDRYRCGLGAKLKELTEQIIETKSQETSAQPQADAPSLVPSSEGQQ